MKKFIFFTGLLSSLTLAIVGFSSFKIDKVDGFHLGEDEVINYHVPTEDETEGFEVATKVPYVGKTYIGFRQAVAYKESRGKSKLVNPYGYMGKYQFGKSTLRAVGVYDFENFLNNVSIQDKAFKALVAKNKWILRKEIEAYSGRVINGVEITESGIVAAAHLSGAGSVKKYLKSNGRNGFKDGFGTSLRSYIKKFASYDISHIKADKNAKVKMN
ncbi:peptidoglycan-binding protein LysM [uncultured Flavobacterium sp.]|uniref:peptidoglycan-binding protein LysM n=1 Tax=uncultured Flavobacterium sp. TaxID=165435 RepID=UPI0030EDA1A4|tara:strand:+ start:15979 stop:16623 length:645 start_codon:yes stop_codon:yes gene_type:complete